MRNFTLIDSCKSRQWLTTGKLDIDWQVRNLALTADKLDINWHWWWNFFSFFSFFLTWIFFPLFFWLQRQHYALNTPQLHLLKKLLYTIHLILFSFFFKFCLPGLTRYPTSRMGLTESFFVPWKAMCQSFQILWVSALATFTLCKQIRYYICSMFVKVQVAWNITAEVQKRKSDTETHYNYLKMCIIPTGTLYLL